MQILEQESLARYTSFGVGGPAERLVIIESADDTAECLSGLTGQRWCLGYGANSLISDAGLPGTTLVFRNSDIQLEDDLLIAESGAWWDDVVQYAIKRELWGLELMSAIPGGAGAAVIGNIAAYGQAVSDTLQWIEVCDPESCTTKRLAADELGLAYRFSDLQKEPLNKLVVLRVAFKLSKQPTGEVEYQSALDVAAENNYDLTTLAGRRQAILEARDKAGSLWDYRSPTTSRTAGSFFRNPVVDAATAERLMALDETGRSAEHIKKMNKVHGGDSQRVSAAHVLLAAGFVRGQAWGPVRLHPEHVLKIENTGGATAQQIHDVAQEIIATVKDRLSIDLTPEVRFLGQF